MPVLKTKHSNIPKSKDNLASYMMRNDARKDEKSFFYNNSSHIFL